MVRKREREQIPHNNDIIELQQNENTITIFMWSKSRPLDRSTQRLPLHGLRETLCPIYFLLSFPQLPFFSERKIKVHQRHKPPQKNKTQNIMRNLYNKIKFQLCQTSKFKINILEICSLNTFQHIPKDHQGKVMSYPLISFSVSVSLRC